MDVNATDANVCWVSWVSGVLILNVIGDILPGIFLGGMFMYR